MLRRLVGVLLMAGAACAGARAADIIEPIPEPLPVPVAGGFYIRGDVGYTFKSHNRGDWDFYNEYYGAQGVDDTFLYQNFRLKGGVDFGGGVGYRFTDKFRADATLDYFDSKFRGNTQCPSYVAASQYAQSAPDITCRYRDRADADILTAMANAYVDLPILPLLTPYLGAGIGAAHVSYGSLRSEECGFNCGDPGNPFFTHDGRDNWRFAYALMAGASFSLTDALKLDAGYRYLRVQDDDAFGYDEASRAAGATGAQLRDHGFDLHQIRAGLRYEFH